MLSQNYPFRNRSSTPNNRQMDRTIYRLDGHISQESSLKISDVYLEQDPRKSRFPHSIYYRQTDGHLELQSSFATNKGTNHANDFNYFRLGFRLGSRVLRLGRQGCQALRCSLGGGEGGTQIFNIKKKISKRNIPNFFACHDGRKCLNYFDLVRAESSLVISFQNLMCWHNLTQQIFPKLPANGATPPENQVFYRKCKKEYNQRTHTTKKKLIKIC